jgi:hypothetical protein
MDIKVYTKQEQEEIASKIEAETLLDYVKEKTKSIGEFISVQEKEDCFILSFKNKDTDYYKDHFKSKENKDVIEIGIAKRSSYKDNKDFYVKTVLSFVNHIVFLTNPGLYESLEKNPENKELLEKINKLYFEELKKLKLKQEKVNR